MQYISANVHGIDTINNSIAGIEIELNNLDNRIKNIDVAAIKGSVDKYAQLPPVSDVPEHSAYIVEEDENKGNASGIYMAVGGSWVFVAKFNIDLSNYYTKPEIDTKINNYYTKTETDSKDTAINTKFDDYYTKPETDNKMNEIEDSLEQRMKTIAIRGGVKTYAGLPDLNNERTGDAYIVERDEHNYGISVIYAVAETSGIKQWVYVAQFIVDLTNYYNKEEIQEMFLDKYYTNDEIDNKLVIIEDKIVVLNNDLLNYYTKQVIDDKVNTVNTEIGTRVTNHNTDLSSHGIDVIKADISELQTKVENIEAISIKGSVDTYASLPVITDLLTGTAYIVEKDENKNNITTIYAVEDNAGIKQWTFIGEFKVDLSNYYNKNEVDELVDIDLSNYYNKIEINDKLVGKAVFDYSTDEQDTGIKWVDGKTIYQKTVSFTTTGTRNQWVKLDTDIIADNIIDYKGVILPAGTQNLIPSPLPGLEIACCTINGVPHIWIVSAAYSNKPAHITFWYTK